MTTLRYTGTFVGHTECCQSFSRSICLRCKGIRGGTKSQSRAEDKPTNHFSVLRCTYWNNDEVKVTIPEKLSMLPVEGLLFVIWFCERSSLICFSRAILFCFQYQTGFLLVTSVQLRLNLSFNVSHKINWDFRLILLSILFCERSRVVYSVVANHSLQYNTTTRKLSVTGVH